MFGLIEKARQALFNLDFQGLKRLAYPEPEMTSLVSQLVTQKQMESEVYKLSCAEIKELPRYHRKQWEYVYVLQALYENNGLRTGTRGIGFGVGKEPLPAVMAKYGCTIVVTDLELEVAKEKGWRDTEQHSNSLEELNERGICEPIPPTGLFSKCRHE